MSERAAGRQRRTNQLARAVAGYLFDQTTILPAQLYGLCKLTWITDSYEGAHAAYLNSTKKPALGEIFKRDYSHASIEEVAADVANIVGSPGLKQLVLSDTGFTNFYKAYRNSASKWIEDNLDSVAPLFRSAYHLGTDTQGLKIIRVIQHLPGIPKANHQKQLMKPEYLLTPAFFSLDARLRFPLINGNEGVKNLLARLKVTRAPLDEQYQEMIGLYGKGGIVDAADLDQAGRDLPDFVAINGKRPTKKLLEEKPTHGRELPLKDESDIESLQRERSVMNRRIHNKLTNKLKACLLNYTLLEGSSDAAMFDVLVKDFNRKGADLLVEVKSSGEAPNVRMAVGQLFDYWFAINGDIAPRLAVLLPNIPDDATTRLLNWLGIGLLWFSGEKLTTSSNWLRVLVD